VWNGWLEDLKWRDCTVTDEIVTLIERRIENAMMARRNVDSCWGKQYWDNVLAYLLRQSNRLN